MKKRPFAMMEITIAIMLFSLCLLPVIGIPFKVVSDQKKTLYKMESYMRAHEAMFFLLQNFNALEPSYTFPRKQTVSKPITGLKLPAPFDKHHYHIYHNNTSCNEGSPPPDDFMLYCNICFDRLDTSHKQPKTHQFYILATHKQEIRHD